MIDDKLIQSIADEIDCGFNCYVHREKCFKFKHESLVYIITERFNFLSNSEMQ